MALNRQALIRAVEKALDNELDSIVQRYKTALTHDADQIMRESILEWYSSAGLATGGDVISALKTTSVLVRGTRYKRTVRITAGFDSGTFDGMSGYYPSAIKWAQRHNDLCGVSVGQYIFSLRWESGILALPAAATATDSGWVNPDFRTSPLGSLCEYCTNALENNLGRNLITSNRNRSMGYGAGRL